MANSNILNSIFGTTGVASSNIGTEVQKQTLTDVQKAAMSGANASKINALKKDEEQTDAVLNMTSDSMKAQVANKNEEIALANAKIASDERLAAEKIASEGRIAGSRASANAAAQKQAIDEQLKKRAIGMSIAQLQKGWGIASKSQTPTDKRLDAVNKSLGFSNIMVNAFGLDPELNTTIASIFNESLGAVGIDDVKATSKGASLNSSVYDMYTSQISIQNAKIPGLDAQGNQTDLNLFDTFYGKDNEFTRYFDSLPSLQENKNNITMLGRFNSLLNNPTV